MGNLNHTMGELRQRSTDMENSRGHLSPISSRRLQAQGVWRGPSDIVIVGPEGDRFFGWSTLSLELRLGRPDRVEARSVYANLFDKEQTFAVLRAVYWDGVAARAALRAGTVNLGDKLVMPARFVYIPVERLRNWLSHFGGVSIVADDVCGVDDSASLRGLRIERDYLSCIFEKVWRLEDVNHDSLNQKWDLVWTQMTEALTAEPHVVEPTEDFWFVEPKFEYDLQAYHPNQLVPK